MNDDTKRAFADRAYWKQYERDGWLLHGFTYRNEALFVKYDGRGNGRSVSVTQDHLELLREGNGHE